MDELRAAVEVRVEIREVRHFDRCVGIVGGVEDAILDSTLEVKQKLRLYSAARGPLFGLLGVLECQLYNGEAQACSQPSERYKSTRYEQNKKLSRGL